MNHLTRWLRYSAIFSLLFIVSCNDDDPVSNNNVRPPDFLTETYFKSLVIEVAYVTGNKPTDQAMNNLKVFLEARLNKPSGISITQKAVASPKLTTLNIDQLKDLEKANRAQITKDDVLTAYFYFADAEYAENVGDKKVLGAAYDRSSMVLFEKTIREFSGGTGKPTVASLETLVLNHEFAHILGLVNNGTPLQSSHQDTAHGAHCNNTECLMHYSAETSDVIANLLGGIPGLDANCIADLKANGGK